MKFLLRTMFTSQEALFDRRFLQSYFVTRQGHNTCPHSNLHFKKSGESLPRYSRKSFRLRKVSDYFPTAPKALYSTPKMMNDSNLTSCHTSVMHFKACFMYYLKFDLIMSQTKDSNSTVISLNHFSMLHRIKAEAIF